MLFFSYRCSITILLLFTLSALQAQEGRVGIGTIYPLARLAVDSSIMLDQDNVNAGTLGSGALLFGSDYSVGIASRKLTGSITRNGLDFYTGGARRMHIDSTGKIGIGTSGPLQQLHVTGNAFITNRLGIGEPSPEYGLDVASTAYFGSNVGIWTVPNPSYSLSVVGAARFYNDLRIDGILNPNNTLTIGNNTAIEGSLTVNNGNGIVRSTTSTQMKIKRASIGLVASNFGAGTTITSGYLNFGEDFSAVTVSVGHCKNAEGVGGEWSKVFIVPFDVDVVNNRCRFKLTNVSNSAISFDASWDIVLVGN
jgi:hypothetical protein